MHLQAELKSQEVDLFSSTKDTATLLREDAKRDPLIRLMSGFIRIALLGCGFLAQVLINTNSMFFAVGVAVCVGVARRRHRFVKLYQAVAN